MSLSRLNYHEESEAGLNKQINTLLHSSYVFQSLAFHFDRDDIALENFSKLFKNLSEKKREHAEELMKYQNLRGGRVVLKDAPSKSEWGTGIEALNTALEMSKFLNQSYTDLVELAEKHGDPHFSDYIEDEFLKYHVELNNTLAQHISNLRRAGPGLGEYMFNKHLSS